MKKIGFIGTGIMGASMAGHLLDAGYELNVYNHTKAKAEGLIARGAHWCPTAGECAVGCDAVISMVGYPKDVEEIYLGSGGIVEKAAKGTYLIDMTTSSPVLAERIAIEGAKQGLKVLDAPVTGGDTGAKNATLTILVGGAEEDFATLQPVFRAMGKNIVLEGGPGAGQKTKMCNQIAIAGALAGACEAFTYAQASGLDIEKVFAAISTGAASSAQMTNVVAKGLKGDFNPGFMLKHFIKDMGISADTSEAYHINLPVLLQVLKEARTLETAGKGTNGTQVLLKYYK
jgi:3-hydroxyisobutyrate dehydrogenase-like beta-hydroxyacid dehydrogenase